MTYGFRIPACFFAVVCEELFAVEGRLAIQDRAHSIYSSERGKFCVRTWAIGIGDYVPISVVVKRFKK